MLGEDERRVLDEIERCWDVEAEEPVSPKGGRRRPVRHPADPPVAVVAAAAASVVLVIEPPVATGCRSTLNGP